MLNDLARSCVTARAQSEAYLRIAPLLTPEEDAVFRRGRNSGAGHAPKSVTRGEYAASTGLEALAGHLWLAGEKSRLYFLLESAFPAGEADGSMEKMSSKI